MKRFIIGILAILMVLSLAACGALVDENDKRTKDAEEAGDAAEQTEEPTPKPTPEPTPEPIPSPAEIFGQEKGAVVPDIGTAIITDAEEIQQIISNQPYWSEAINGDAALYGETSLIWYKADGRYRVYSDFLDIGYCAGKWYFEDGMMVTEPLERVNDDLTDEIKDLDEEETEGLEDLLEEYRFEEILIAAELDDGIHLYSCFEDSYIEYVPATDEERLTVSTDPQAIANIRNFLCSATWLLVGHYDEAGNYSHRSNNVAYTFLADGQLVVKQSGENIAGHYTLNIGDGGFYQLCYLLEDGQSLDTPLWADNSSSYASSIFLYPISMSNESDVYMAKSKYNVSKIVAECEPIMSYQDAVLAETSSSGSTFDLSNMDIDMQVIVIDSVWYSGYTVKDIYSSSGEEVESVVVTFEDSSILNISDIENATLIFNCGEEHYNNPLLWLGGELFDSPVTGISLNE